MKTIWGKKQLSITLDCDVSTQLTSKYTVDWRKNGQLIMSAFSDQLPHIAPSHQGRIARDGGLGLTIHALQDSDQGLYQCTVSQFVSQPTKPIQGTSLKVLVHVTPTINNLKQRETIYRKVGSKLFIECKADGAPPPEITWYKADNIISTSSILNIEKIDESHSGQYSCLAVNVEGNATSTLNVEISKPTTLELVPANKTVNEGSNVYWHCHANSQPGTISYSWSVDDKPIKMTPTGLRASIMAGDLSLQDVRKSDRGWYSCEASNSDGEATKSAAYLEVLYAPEVLANHLPVRSIASNKKFSITCEVEANPAPTLYTWSKNGYFLGTSSKNEWTIDKAKSTDGGIYSCEAENAVGKGTPVETHIVVADPPVFSTVPPPELHVRQGETVSVPCNGFGDPLPVIYWTRNKKRISSSVLNIKAASHKDHGIYHCVLSNSVETKYAPMTILVESTHPQPVTAVNITCKDQFSFHIGWSPGYNGGFEQMYAIHVKDSETGTSSTILTSSESTLFTEQYPFSTYQITIESRNVKGSTNSTTFDRQSCSKLEPPKTVAQCSIDQICWTKVNGASSYSVEMKYPLSSTFQKAAEVKEEIYHLKSAPRQPFDIRVRSLRPGYGPSQPSEILSLRSGEGFDSTVLVALSVGSLLFLILMFLYFCSRKCFRKLRKSKKSSRSSLMYQDSKTESTPPGTETYYEPSLRLPEEVEWKGPRDEVTSFWYPQSFMEYDFEEENENVVDDMLRDKYIYQSDDAPVQFYQHLRLERLKREYKQSQL